MALKLQSKLSLTAHTPNKVAQSRLHAFFLIHREECKNSINSGKKTTFALR